MKLGITKDVDYRSCFLVKGFDHVSMYEFSNWSVKYQSSVLSDMHGPWEQHFQKATSYDLVYLLYSV